MKNYCRLIVVVVALIALQSAAVTIHRSFRTREAGFGFGTGTAGVAYPVDARIDKAIDEARQKEAEKVKVIIEANDCRKNKTKSLFENESVVALWPC